MLLVVFEERVELSGDIHGGRRDCRASLWERQGALNRCALQDRHTTGVAARLLTSRLSFENYGPITTDTPPGSAGNRRDTRTPGSALARSRSSAEEPGHKSLAAARTPLPAAVLVRTRQRAQAARKQLRAAARRRAAQQRPSDERRRGSR